jgi:hypothetical protein
MSQLFIQDWAQSLNILQPKNESWIQAIANYYGATEPVNGSWEQAIALKLNATTPLNGTWVQRIASELGSLNPVNQNWIQAILGGFSSEYNAILAEAAALGYTAPSAGQQVKQNLFIQSLKSSGVWDKSDRIFVFANDGSKEFACINWKAPSGTKASLVNPTLLTFTPNQGFTGNGTSSYIDTNYNPNGTLNYKQNDASRYAYLRVSVNNRVIDGVSDNITNSMTTFASPNQRINQSGNNISATFSYQGVGMKSIHRTSTTAVTCYNDAIGTTFTASPTSLSNSNQFILRSSPSGYSAHQVSFYLMGASLISENSSLVSAFSTYLVSL